MLGYNSCLSHRYGVKAWVNNEKFMPWSLCTTVNLYIQNIPSKKQYAVGYLSLVIIEFFNYQTGILYHEY